MIKEKPILFNGDMVRAILDGRKTQTRRVVNPMGGEQKKWLTPDLINKVPHGEIINGGWQMHHPKAGENHMGVHVENNSPLGWIKCPFGAVGGNLWVRETFQLWDVWDDGIIYRADNEKYDGLGKWKPSVHMPRWASRIQLEITDIRVERLQDISNDDVFAEGIDMWKCGIPKLGFFDVWQSINGAKSWDANPWVWVVEFKRLNP